MRCESERVIVGMCCWSGDKMDYVQDMSGGKEDEMDALRQRCVLSRAKTVTLMAVSFQGVGVVLRIF